VETRCKESVQLLSIRFEDRPQTVRTGISFAYSVSATALYKTVSGSPGLCRVAPGCPPPKAQSPPRPLQTTPARDVDVTNALQESEAR